MGRTAFACQSFPLLYSETVLLVCYDQSQIMIGYLILDQSVSAYDDRDFARGNPFISFAVIDPVRSSAFTGIW